MRRLPLSLLAVLLVTGCSTPQSVASNPSSVESKESSSLPAQSSAEASSSQEQTTQQAEELTSIESSEESKTSAELPSFVEKEVDVHYLNQELNQKVKVRFYNPEDQIPYLSFNDFYNIYFKGTRVKNGRTVKNGSVYSVYPEQGSAEIDVEKNTFLCPDILPFTNDVIVHGEGLPNAPHDGLPYIRPIGMTAKGLPKATTIDFANYHVKAYGDEQNVYLPFLTWANIIICMSGRKIIYDRQSFYVLAPLDDVSEFKLSADNIFKDVPTAYALHDYYMVCLHYDYFTGRPTRQLLEKKFDLSEGLDKALEKSSFKTTIRDLMASGDPVDYYIAYNYLNILVEDGGHSSFYFEPNHSDFGHAPSWHTEDFYQRVLARLQEVKGENGFPEVAGFNPSQKYYSVIRNQRSVALDGKENSSSVHGDRSYHVKGDTALISFDNFLGDIYAKDKWLDYYAGKGEIPYDDNTGGVASIVHHGLQKAAKDPNIKNVVFDISANNGGSSDEMMYLLSIAYGEDTYHVKHYGNGQQINYMYEVDRNLDGKFDEADKTYNPLEGKNVAFITSSTSFSCGGIAPAMMHENGIYGLGENCGGGSCAVYENPNGYGFTYRSSCPFQLCNERFSCVDDLRFHSIDTPITISQTVDRENNPIPDYSAFFNLDNLSNLIHNHYGK